MIFAGIDPSASPDRPSGICLMNSKLRVRFIGIWYHFNELGELLRPLCPRIESIGVDGPLQPPFELDRCCFSDALPRCRHQQTTPFKGRYCEYLLIKNGFRCFVTSRNSFARHWMRRCFELNDYLRDRAFKTLEVYPTAARKILFPHIKGKKQLSSNRKRLQESLWEWGVCLASRNHIYSHHELDALLAAVTVWLHWKGRGVMFGDRRDGYIIVPQTELTGGSR